MDTPNRDADQQESNENPLETNGPPFSNAKISPELNTQAPQKATSETKNEEEPTVNRDWHKPLEIPITEWVTAFFTCVIMVSSIFYTVYAKRQWKVMRESNAINRESLESVQRAFISFHQIEASRLTGPDNFDEHYWKFTADFENGGTTPAIDAISTFGIQDFPSEPTEEQFQGKVGTFQRTYIAPKATTSIGPQSKPEERVFGINLGRTFTPEIAAKTHVNRNLFFWGWVKYRDIFPETKPHVSEFCWRLNDIYLTSDPNIKGNPTAQFRYVLCAQHNCTDEHCKDYEEILSIDK